MHNRFRLSFKVRETPFIECAVMFMMFYTAPLFSYCPIRFSEVGAIMIIWLALKKSNEWSAKWPSLLYISLGLWAVFDGYFLSYHNYFIMGNHVTQLIRLLLGISMFVAIPTAFNDISTLSLIHILKRILLINLWIQISYIILFQLLGHYFFTVISSGEERASLISENYKFFNHLVIVNTQKGYPQFSGIFDEPAWFGWNINLIIAFLLQLEVICKYKIIERKTWVLILISYFFTFSLAAIGGLTIIWLVYYVYTHKHKIVKTTLTILFVVILMLGYILLNPALILRLTLINQGGDGSTTARIIGSWNALNTVLKNNILTGFGLGDGNMASYFNEIIKSGQQEGIFRNYIILDIHNVIAQVVCSLGIVGAILYFTPVLMLYKKKTIIVAVGFIIIYFSVNVFNTFYLFFMTSIALYYFTSIYRPRQIRYS